MMIKAILFDFDGTLSNRVLSAYRMYRWILKQMMPEADDNSMEFEAMVQRCMLWDEFGTINKRHVLSQIKKYFVPDLDIEQWVPVWYENFHLHHVLQDDVEEVLEKLSKKYRLGIISNGNGKYQAAKIDFLGIRKYFGTVILSQNFGKDKPDVSIYEAAAKDLGVKCEEVAFIGDTFATDILGATRAGMLPIWYCFEHYSVTNFDVLQMSSYRQIERYFLENQEA